MNKSNNKIFIGLPVFNGEKYISQAIESVLSQTYSNFILFISDNCSTDNTKQICLKYKKQDVRVKYVIQNNNIGAKKNFLFLKKQSEKYNLGYFIFIAYDDYWSSGYLQDLQSLLRSDDFGLRGLTKNIDENNNDIGTINQRNFKKGQVKQAFLNNEKYCKGLYIYSLFNYKFFKSFDLADKYSNLHGADVFLPIFFVEHGNLRVVSEQIHFYRTHTEASSYALGKKNFGLNRFLFYFIPIKQFLFLHNKLNIKLPIHIYFIKYIKLILDSTFRVLIFLILNKKY
jgi:glycosyltransferase involved in cell wall biosynthesis